MKRAGLPGASSKSGPPLKTAPVGALSGGLSRPTLTTSDRIDPVPVYSVDRLVPLSATHHGVPLGKPGDTGPATRPHAFTRFGSWCKATFGWFETSGVTV